MRALSLFVVLSVAACGGDAEIRSPGGEGTTANAAEASSRDGAPLCDRIEDDEALTPAGAETIEIPGVREANSPRRCMRAFGVDLPIDEVRGFYRSTLPERGYEIARDEVTDGMMSGNLSRTFLRATKPGRQVNLTLDEFEPESSLSEHTVNVKLQLDATGG